MKKVTQLLSLVTGLLFAMCAGSISGRGQSISLTSVSGSEFCASSTITVGFAVDADFGHLNAFTLQLSDPDGSFASGFRNLGSLFDSVSGPHTITATIPTDIKTSTHYRVRIMGAVPYVTSADNGSDLTVSEGPFPRIDLSRFSVKNIPEHPSIFDEVALLVYVPRDEPEFDTLAALWNFGADATPASATKIFDNTVTYSSPGTKHVSLNLSNAMGCSYTVPGMFDVYGCSKPTIPDSAIVIAHDTVWKGNSSALWVNPGVSLMVTGHLNRVFAEPGSTISLASGEDTIYLKPGAVLDYQRFEPIVVFATGAGISSNYYNGINCPNLDFDYSIAPPNSIVTAGVQDDVRLSDVSVSPNPTNGFVTVRGLGDGITTRVSVLNILGASIRELVHPRGEQLQFDLSMESAGTYFVRIETNGSVVTKRIVKQ